MIRIDVIGQPAPQGSKRARPVYTGRGPARRFTGHVALQEMSRMVGPWRDAVRAAVALTGRAPRYTGPVAVQIVFRLARPRSHYGTGRNARRLRPSAPLNPISRPDLDKLTRSTLDALMLARVFVDDSQVCALDVSKRYAIPGEAPGALITVTGTHDQKGQP